MRGLYEKSQSMGTLFKHMEFGDIPNLYHASLEITNIQLKSKYLLYTAA